MLLNKEEEAFDAVFNMPPDSGDAGGTENACGKASIKCNLDRNGEEDTSVEKKSDWTTEVEDDAEMGDIVDAVAPKSVQGLKLGVSSKDKSWLEIGKVVGCAAAGAATVAIAPVALGAAAGITAAGPVAGGAFAAAQAAGMAGGVLAGVQSSVMGGVATSTVVAGEGALGPPLEHGRRSVTIREKRQ